MSSTDLSNLDFSNNFDSNDVDSQSVTSSFAFQTYTYKDNIFFNLDKLVEQGRSLDGIVIDLMNVGFTVSLEELVKFSVYAKRLLKHQGVLLFVKYDGAVTFSKDETSGALNFNAYDSPSGIFTRYPMLANHVCATVKNIDRRRWHAGSTSLANHILFNSIPVLTSKGSIAKSGFGLPNQLNWVIQLIDNYSTVESIITQMEKNQRIESDEVLRLIQEIEGQGLIFPLFKRVQFLSGCYRNRKPFRLGRYLVASGILSEGQLQELLEKQEEEGWGKAQKTFLGVLAVRAGFISTRQLEVLLEDQYLYGGYNKVSDTGTASNKLSSFESMKDSMMGSLNAIDPSSLLQSLSAAGKTGLLTVENLNNIILFKFANGRVTHAKYGDFLGNDAIIQFLMSWTEGIFIFKDKADNKELDASCKLEANLDKLLLDCAVLKDDMAKFVSELPAGQKTVLERVWNFNQIWTSQRHKKMYYVDGSLITEPDKEKIESLIVLIDGFSTVEEIIKKFNQWSEFKILKAINFLLFNKLLNIQQASLYQPLSIFQSIVVELKEVIGVKDNKAILEASLYYVHGDSPVRQCFYVDNENRISINLSHVKSANLAMTNVLFDLRKWLDAYIAYCRRHIDESVVDRIVSQTIKTKSI